MFLYHPFLLYCHLLRIYAHLFLSVCVLFTLSHAGILHHGVPLEMHWPRISLKARHSVAIEASDKLRYHASMARSCFATIDNVIGKTRYSVHSHASSLAASPSASTVLAVSTRGHILP